MKTNGTKTITSDKQTRKIISVFGKIASIYENFFHGYQKPITQTSGLLWRVISFLESYNGMKTIPMVELKIFFSFAKLRDNGVFHNDFRAKYKRANTNCYTITIEKESIKILIILLAYDIR